MSAWKSWVGLELLSSIAAESAEIASPAESADHKKDATSSLSFPCNNARCAGKQNSNGSSCSPHNRALNPIARSVIPVFNKAPKRYWAKVVVTCKHVLHIDSLWLLCLCPVCSRRRLVGITLSGPVRNAKQRQIRESCEAATGFHLHFQSLDAITKFHLQLPAAVAFEPRFVVRAAGGATDEVHSWYWLPTNPCAIGVRLLPTIAHCTWRACATANLQLLVLCAMCLKLPQFACMKNLISAFGLPVVMEKRIAKLSLLTVTVVPSTDAPAGNGRADGTLGRDVIWFRSIRVLKDFSCAFYSAGRSVQLLRHDECRMLEFLMHRDCCCTQCVLLASMSESWHRQGGALSSATSLRLHLSFYRASRASSAFSILVRMAVLHARHVLMTSADDIRVKCSSSSPISLSI
ncbi:hypothetical protein Efla_006033 [Eimeria flavescens]